MFAVAHLRDPRRDRAILAGSLVALSGARLAQPVGLGGLAVRRATSTTTAASPPCPVEALLFSLGWVLMIVAMMLPSSVPLVVTFGAIVGRRPQPRRLVALLVAGYLVDLGRVRPRGLGPRPRHPRGRRRLALARRSTRS